MRDLQMLNCVKRCTKLAAKRPAGRIVNEASIQNGQTMMAIYETSWDTQILPEMKNATDCWSDSKSEIIHYEKYRRTLALACS